MRILALGDIAGPAALDTVCKKLWKYRKDNNIDFVIANGENCAEGNGIDKESAEKLFICGADVITTGNHIWKKRSVRTYLDDCTDIIRPINYPTLENGFGSTIKECCEKRILVMNVSGKVFMGDHIDDPIRSVEKELSKHEGNFDYSVLDIHAEATSEKYAIGRYFDGKIDVIYGTHTHVQTADEQILPNGSAFICDLGMCGSQESILGIKSDIIISRYLGKEGQKFVFEDKNIALCGIVVDIDNGNKTIRRVKITD